MKQEYFVFTDFTPNRKLYVRVEQADVETNHYMICLPGGPGGDSTLFENQSAQLKKHSNLIFFDPRGCGKSESCSYKEYDMEYYIRDIEAIRKYLNIEKWFVLGASYGSMAAIGYAIRNSHSISGLILANGALSFQFIDEALKKTQRIGTAAQVTMLRKLFDGNIKTSEDFEEYSLVMSNLYSTTLSKPSSNNKYSKVNVDALNAGFAPGGFLHSFDWRKYLHKIFCPVLIMVGDKDFITPAESLDPDGAIPNCSFHIISGAHKLSIDNERKYYGLINSFMSSLL